MPAYAAASVSIAEGAACERETPLDRCLGNIRQSFFRFDGLLISGAPGLVAVRSRFGDIPGNILQNSW